MVPANTGSPAVFSTGRLSPVMGAWSTVEAPCSTWPSSAMRSPGRTRTRVPTATSPAGTDCQLPSDCCAVAVSGARRIRPSMAWRARSSERASIISESVNSTITIDASGHCPISRPPVTAMLIRALMLSVPVRMEIQPFRYVLRPQSSTAPTASMAVSHSGYANQWQASDRMARMAALPRRRRGVAVRKAYRRAARKGRCRGVAVSSPPASGVPPQQDEVAVPMSACVWASCPEAFRWACPVDPACSWPLQHSCPLP